MLSEKQISEIREHLEIAQNPVFFFDNDQDGLCSFLILQRAFGKGKGVPIRSFPSLDREYFRKVSEFNSDYIFILDKPIVSKEFFEEAERVNLPIVWIDHHDVPERKIPEFVSYYSPLESPDKSNEPVTSICYRLFGKKEDLWLAVAGCVADKFLPDFYSDFEKTFPDLSFPGETNDAFDVFYNSQIGRISRIIGFGLKDRTTNVLQMIRFLLKVKNPYAVLEESRESRSFRQRFDSLFPKYTVLLKKAKTFFSDESKVLFFKYSGDFSVSSDLANELIYIFPKKIIIVAYVSGGKVNLSIRGKNVRGKFLRILPEFESVRGGGHDDAVGANLSLNELEDFRKKFESYF